MGLHSFIRVVKLINGGMRIFPVLSDIIKYPV